MPSGRGANWIWSPSTATATRCSVIARLLGIPAANEEQLFAWVRGLFDYPFQPAGRAQGRARR